MLILYWFHKCFQVKCPRGAIDLTPPPFTHPDLSSIHPCVESEAWGNPCSSAPLGHLEMLIFIGFIRVFGSSAPLGHLILLVFHWFYKGFHEFRVFQMGGFEHHYQITHDIDG